MPTTTSVICQQNGLLKNGVDFYLISKSTIFSHKTSHMLLTWFPVAIRWHLLEFKDPAGIAKKVGRGVASAYGELGCTIIGIGFGIVEEPERLLTGGTSGTGKNIGHSLGQKLFGSGANDSRVYEITFREGDILNVTCIKDRKSGIIIKSD